MRDGYTIYIQVIWCSGCSRLYKAIHAPILVGLHHSTDCSVVLPQCTEVDRCTRQCSPSAVPTPTDCKALKWFRTLSKIAPHVKVPDPHPDPLSAGGVSIWVAVGSFGGVVTGVVNPVPPVGGLWIVFDYLLAAISWVVVGQSKPPLPLHPPSQITVHLLCNLLIQFSFDVSLCIAIQHCDPRGPRQPPWASPPRISSRSSLPSRSLSTRWTRAAWEGGDKTTACKAVHSEAKDACRLDGDTPNPLQCLDYICMVC